MAVPIITVSDVETALGRTFTAEEEAQATYYINRISAFIGSYCDLISLEEVVDDEIRAQADYYGIIEVGGGPISVVTSVEAVDGTGEVGYSFDGSNRIFGFEPFQTVDIVLTRGSDVIPEDLKQVALDAVVDVMRLPSEVRLTQRKVGDITYVYENGDGTATVQFSQNVLDRYATTEYTWRLGSPMIEPNVLPENWFQIGG